MGALKPDSVSTALRDSDPHVREHGIRLSEQFIGGGARVASPRGQASSQDRPGCGPRGATSPLKSGHDGASPQPMDDLQKLLLKLVEDEDARVRLQLALTLDAVESEQKLPALARLTELGSQDRWQPLAVLTSAGHQSWRFWTTLYDESRNREKEPNEANAQFADKLGNLLGANLSAADWQEAARWLSNSAQPLFIRLALFDALTEAAKRDSYLRQALGQSGLTAAGKPWSFDDLRAEARTAAASPDAVLPVRTLAIRVLGKSDPNLGRTTLLGLLKSSRPPEVQSAAVRALAQLNDGAAATNVFAEWPDYSKSTRQQLVGAALRSSAIATALLDELDAGKIAPIEVDASTRQGLLKLPNAPLRQRAEELFRNSSDRDEVIRRFQPCLQLEGDRRHGAVIFARACLICHAMQGRGGAIGPNIYSVASQPRETLLASILDPSRQVTPDYLSYTITMADGGTLTGLIAAESATAVTMRRQSVPDVTLQRDQIKEMMAQGKSLMPDGLEQGLTQQDVADLISFIRQPDDKLLPQDN